MSVKKIIGRAKEIKILDAVCKSKEAEFIAVYGRRRVGKTYLIREYFSDKGLYLETSGAKDKPLKKQLENFMKSFSQTFFKGVPLHTPDSWDAAFELLTKELKGVAKTRKVIIFLDELPWMVTKKSGMLQSLDYYWNLYWSRMPNLILIVCGSAASWILDKLIYAKGGLHKRITRKILLEPFHLKETREFLIHHSVKLNEKQILDIYMAIGGVPFYLKAVTSGMSAAQNIEAICFQKNGLLYNEFANLFESLFEHADVNLSIVREIVNHGNEILREDLIRATGIKSGGTLNKRLRELEAANFIQSFLPYGYKKRNLFYRVIDEFSLFHLKWIEPLIDSGIGMDEGYWQILMNTPIVKNWTGYAFENVCLKHISQIRRALGLEKVACLTGRWRHISKKGSQDDGAQIDLLFDRQDGIITLCEIKYSEKPYVIDKDYGKQLLRKEDVFKKVVKTSKQIFLAMITVTGLKRNLWSEELVHNEVVLADLFTF
ncbi:MAG: ATP-binding protein [Chlamydiales bacterium]